jgi:hypothetical protein
MKIALALLIAGACIATPCLSAPERFAADKPTPLKRVKSGQDDGNVVRFAGSARLSGQFLIVWERKDDKPLYRQITFFPDVESAALLPHPVDAGAVTELLFSNRAQAGAMLIDLATVQKALARAQIGSQGAATVTIRNYQVVVECDHRWYLAELVSVVNDKPIVVSAREAHPGC